MQKNFDFWNNKKKQIHNKEHTVLFSEREIWWCALGVNIGHEEDGKGDSSLRPVLIIRKFNKTIFYGIPITSKKKENIFHFSIDCGEVNGSAILSQMRLIDSKRLSHLMCKIDSNDFSVIREKLKRLFP